MHRSYHDCCGLQSHDHVNNNIKGFFLTHDADRYCVKINGLTRNCIPLMKSARTSSPKAKRKGLKPKVSPVMSKICNAEKKPLSIVVMT